MKNKLVSAEMPARVALAFGLIRVCPQSRLLYGQTLITIGCTAGGGTEEKEYTTISFSSPNRSTIVRA
jgi:hypothetical protein